MIMSEFTERTGIEPTNEEYSVIEELYYEFDGDKNAFCKDFVEQNRMFEVIRTLVAKYQAKAECAEEDLTGKRIAIDALKRRIEDLEGWKPYEDPHNAKQHFYEELERSISHGTRVLSDEEAVEMIASEFGFAPERITIVHEVPKFEISTERHIRKVGSYERKALFDAWDYNYIRFDVRGNVVMSYEMIDGELSLFNC